MTISELQNHYLQTQKTPYITIDHPYSCGALNTAHIARIAAKQLIKAIVLTTHDHHRIIALVPAYKKIPLRWLNEVLDKKYEFIAEESLSLLFQDCDVGAIPALGEAYGIDVIVDSDLLAETELYMEGGNHRDLINIKKNDFTQLMSNAEIITFPDTDAYTLMTEGFNYQSILVQ